MSAWELAMLFDTYGGMLTDKQKDCFDMRYNQDLSLGEIALDLGVSRQAVCDNLTRTEALLRKMEANVGYVSKDLKLRKALAALEKDAKQLADHTDSNVSRVAQQMLRSLDAVKE